MNPDVELLCETISGIEESTNKYDNFRYFLKSETRFCCMSDV